MSSNRDKILALYSAGGEDSRFSQSRANYMEAHYTKKLMQAYITPGADVIELGCATGYYGMFFAGQCAAYTGVDLTEENIRIFQAKIAEARLGNLSAVVGDATNLQGIASESYDVVMCLGPMYHLPEQERQQVFAECHRVARKGGIIAFAYINRIGVYAGACVHDSWREIYPNANTSRHVFELNTDDEKPGVFFFTSPEEMQADAARHGLEILENRGLDFFFAACAIDQMTDAQFELYLELADRMHESPSCVGLANHALLVCRKPV